MMYVSVGIVVSGRAAVSFADRRQYELHPGDIFHILPGYDSWVLGDEHLPANRRWTAGILNNSRASTRGHGLSCNNEMPVHSLRPGYRLIYGLKSAEI